ncbi:MAG: hypothetical protein P8Z75_01475 [Gammaproteobacteria bacterium]
MIVRSVLLAFVWGISATAFAWTYSAPITVNTLSKPGTFLHLESSGNRSLALGKSTIAVAWEDNRSGQPQVYVAYKSHTSKSFTAAQRVSADGPAYEPAIAALPDRGFIVAWEAKGHVWARLVSPGHRAELQRVSNALARQVTISVAPSGKIWLAWSARAGRHYQIVVTTARVKSGQLQVEAARAVDPVAPRQDQQYPSLAVSADGTTVAWEDRRYGHTRIFTAFAYPGQWFSPLRQLNRVKRHRRDVIGNGTGSMRVVLASNGKHSIVASWLDKRNFAEGYDVYAAFSHDGGKTFGKNEKVQDMFGADQAQWHAVSAMDQRGHALVAWDDQRNGNPDIWMSWRDNQGWSDDESPAGAGGPGAQTHPALVFDEHGRAHIAYLDQQQGQSSIRYLVATPDKGEFADSP